MQKDQEELFILGELSFHENSLRRCSRFLSAIPHEQDTLEHTGQMSTGLPEGGSLSTICQNLPLNRRAPADGRERHAPCVTPFSDYSAAGLS